MNKWIKKLNGRKEKTLFRRCFPIQRKKNGRVLISDKWYWDFSSNDYLGLSQDTQLCEAAKRVLHEHGMGSGGSRLLSGNSNLFHELETRVAQLKQKETALIFTSGYQANVGIISALLEEKDVVFADKHIHASLVDGIQLSHAALYRYRHNDMAHLENLLIKQRNRFSNAMIVTESLFSMDGDHPPMEEIIELKNSFNCLLMVDEAHAFGALGKNGKGFISDKKTIAAVDLMVGTFGKALGGHGAFVACSSVLRDYLINFCRSFMYSTALPSVVIGWNIAAMDSLPFLEEKRKTLLEKSFTFRNQLHSFFNGIPGNAYIIPGITGKCQTALDLAQFLQEKGFWVLPIRTPTVPENHARVRFSLTSCHTQIVLDELYEAVKKYFYLQG